MNADERRLKRLAKRIAADLFTPAAEPPVDRLVPTRADGLTRGGWGQGVVADRIYDRLSKAKLLRPKPGRR